MTLEPRKKKPLVITDKDGNVIDLSSGHGKSLVSPDGDYDWDDSKQARRPPQFVSFDVGGQIFKVSCSILEQYPESTLAVLALEAPRRDKDPESPIFIDGDGERFRYCLDYLRHGRAYLPWTISKEAILQDLEYYGIVNINIDAIDESSASLTAAGQMFKVEREYQKELREYDAQIQEIERAKRCFMVAHACFKKFSRTGSLNELTFDPDISTPSNRGTQVPQKDDDDVSYEDACSVFQFFDETMFNKCLAKYGLYHIRNELYRPPGSASFGYQVSLGKVADQQVPNHSIP